MARELGVQTRGAPVKAASTDTAVMGADNTVVARPGKRSITRVTGCSTRAAVQNAWDLRIFFLGSFAGFVAAAVTFFCLAKGMHMASLVTGCVLFTAVLGASPLLLQKINDLRDKLSVSPSDGWFYVGLTMLGAPLGIGFGLWLG